MQIEDLLDLKPAALSSGQKQRGNIARALIRRPAVLLLEIGALEKGDSHRLAFMAWSMVHGVAKLTISHQLPFREAGLLEFTDAISRVLYRDWLVRGQGDENSRGSLEIAALVVSVSRPYREASRVRDLVGDPTVHRAAQTARKTLSNPAGHGCEGPQPSRFNIPQAQPTRKQNSLQPSNSPMNFVQSFGHGLDSVEIFVY